MAEDYILNAKKDLTEEFGKCMRRNNVKRASGEWSEYHRAVKIAEAELGTKYISSLKDMIYLWVLPKDGNG